MRARQALKLSVEMRLRFEIAYARARIEQGYMRVQREIHDFSKVSEAAMIELHEAEQILTALERVSGDFYRRGIEDMKAYRDEQKRRAQEDAEEALAAARGK